MIRIVDYGAGNLMSVKKALDWLGQDSAITSDPAEVRRAFLSASNRPMSAGINWKSLPAHPCSVACRHLRLSTSPTPIMRPSAALPSQAVNMGGRSPPPSSAIWFSACNFILKNPARAD